MQARGQEDLGDLVAEAGGDGRPGQQGPPVGPVPGLLGQLAGGGLGGLPVDVAGAGGDLEQPVVHRRAVLADQHHGVAVGDRHHGDRPGVAHDVPLEGDAVGVEDRRPLDPDQPAQMDGLRGDRGEHGQPVAGVVPPASADGTDVDQVRVASLGPGQGGAHQLAEERVGLVGSALELRVGLRADPERVAGQLDELHQPTVRREPRTDQAGLLQATAVARVDLVAVAVALGHHHVAVGPGHLGAGQQPGSYEPSRMVPPLSATSTWSSIRSTTAWRVVASNSRELAPARPARSRATSMIITWRPRHSPSSGSSCSRA